MTREFIFHKSTKNTYVYKEEPGENALLPEMCGTIYVQKLSLPSKPQRIKVTIEEMKP